MSGNKKIFLLLAVVLLALTAVYLYSHNKGRHLRGTAYASDDGGTYLIVVDVNPACEAPQVDEKKWPYNEKGSISPGVHKIECGGEISFEIPAGTMFRFDYWGP